MSPKIITITSCPADLEQQIRSEIGRGDQPIFEGWTTPDRCVEMAQMVYRFKPKIYVEVGVFGARTLVSVALAMMHNKFGRAYGIDPYKTPANLEGLTDQENIKWWNKVDINAIHQGAMNHIWRLGVEERCVMIRAEAQYCSKLFRQLSVDMLYIDGNHSEAASCRDVAMYFGVVSLGGFIIFDDVNWIEGGVNTTAKAVSILHEKCKGKIYHDGGNYRIYRKPYPRSESNETLDADIAKDQSEREDADWLKLHPENA
jgi:hypothetical protein